MRPPGRSVMLPRLVRAVVLSLLCSTSLWSAEFMRGDANADGRLSIADAIHMLRYMFAGGADLECRDAADVNDNGTNEISDTVGRLNFLFAGGLPPQDPWPECGLDKGDESIDCEGYPFCE